MERWGKQTIRGPLGGMKIGIPQVNPDLPGGLELHLTNN